MARHDLHLQKSFKIFINEKNKKIHLFNGGTVCRVRFCAATKRFNTDAIVETGD
jgi:hypothetical protein